MHERSRGVVKAGVNDLHLGRERKRAMTQRGRDRRTAEGTPSRSARAAGEAGGRGKGKRAAPAR